jgi:hypothetical protein
MPFRAPRIVNLQNTYKMLNGYNNLLDHLIDFVIRLTMYEPEK